MGLLDRLGSLFGSSGKRGGDAYWVAVKCKRCGEIIRSRVDLRNDLSVQYGEGGAEGTYFCRKTLMGEARCFNRVEVELTFDRDRHLINREITGGEFVDEES